jgi:hypothetical protein
MTSHNHPLKFKQIIKKKKISSVILTGQDAHVSFLLFYLQNCQNMAPTHIFRAKKRLGTENLHDSPTLPLITDFSVCPCRSQETKLKAPGTHTHTAHELAFSIRREQAR